MLQCKTPKLLIHPALLDRLDLLRQFYDEVLIPLAVWKVDQINETSATNQINEIDNSRVSQ